MVKGKFCFLRQRIELVVANETLKLALSLSGQSKLIYPLALCNVSSSNAFGRGSFDDDTTTEVVANTRKFVFAWNGI